MCGRLRHRRRRSRRSILTLALIDPFHHVPGDVYADGSADTHRVEFRLIRWRVVLNVTRGIARMPLFTAPAITRDVAKNIPVSDCEAVGFANLIRGISKTFR